MIADGMTANLMVGVGENYFPAFVLAATGSQLACGLTASAPLVIGAVMQLASPALRRWIRSYRTLVTACVIIQTLSFLPLIWSALRGSGSVAVLFAVISVYWASGLTVLPAWNGWVELLVSERIRTRYFARRTRFTQLGLLIGILSGGIVLQIGAHYDSRLNAFALIFVIAVVSRMVSAYFLTQHADRTADSSSAGLREIFGDFGRLVRTGGQGTAIVYVLLAQFASQIAGPYFTPYMLGRLKLPYAQYVFLISALYISKVVFLPTWGRVIERIGLRRVLWITGLAIVPLSMLWNVSDSVAYLVCLQIVAGVVWGPFELASMLLLLNSVPASQKLGVLTVNNLFNASAYMLGSIFGGWILWSLGAEGYHLIFAVSTSVRLVVFLACFPLPAIVRSVTTRFADNASESLEPEFLVPHPHLATERPAKNLTPPIASLSETAQP